MKRIMLPVFILLVLVLFITCKQKKKETTEKIKFFPVLSFIKSQVAHVDTSMYSIRKITFTDSTKTDTAYYKREQFGELASDFLDIPDISDSKYQTRFTESRIMDNTLNKVIVTYTPVNPGNEEIQRQEILIQPNPSAEDKITNIIIDYVINNKDSSVLKRMLWKVDKSFQVIKTRQLTGRPDSTTKIKVIWNDDELE
jgi:hypothetical protein